MFVKEAEKIKSLLEWEIKDTNIIPYSDTKKRIHYVDHQVFSNAIFYCHCLLAEKVHFIFNDCMAVTDAIIGANLSDEEAVDLFDIFILISEWYADDILYYLSYHTETKEQVVNLIISKETLLREALTVVKALNEVPFWVLLRAGLFIAQGVRYDFIKSYEIFPPEIGEIIEAFLNDTEHYISLQAVESLINNLLKIKYKHISVQLIPDGIIIRVNK